MQERFDNQDRPEWRQFELEKIPEAVELITLADQATNNLLRKHGRETFDIPPENYHIFNKKGWKKFNPGVHDGAYEMEHQAIFVRAALAKDPALFGLVAYHEMLHF